MKPFLKTIVAGTLPAIAITGTLQADVTAPPASTVATTQPATQPAPPAPPVPQPDLSIQVVDGIRL